MNAREVITVLDKALPDDVVIGELRSVLRNNEVDGGTRVEVNEEWIVIPQQVDVFVVTKTLFKEYYDAGFPTGYRVQVAVGAVIVSSSGLSAEYCFATLFFDEMGQCFTVDFHANFR